MLFILLFPWVAILAGLVAVPTAAVLIVSVAVSTVGLAAFLLI